MQLKRAAIACLYMAMGIALAGVASKEGVLRYRMSHSGDVAEATVTETNTFLSGRKRQYIRYQFYVDNIRYTAGDSLGRANLWIALPRQKGEHLGLNDEIRVRYLRSTPSINQPVDSASGLLDVVVAVILGVGAILLGLLVWPRRATSQEINR